VEVNLLAGMDAPSLRSVLRVVACHGGGARRVPVGRRLKARDQL
jgi:hypothetical protein